MRNAVPRLPAHVQAEVDAVLADSPPHIVACGAAFAARAAWIALAGRIAWVHHHATTPPRGGRPGACAPSFRRLARELRDIADQADIAAEDAEDAED